MIVDSVIERRLLVSYRADPAVVRPLVPEPLRVRLLDGVAIVGVCLIRLGAVRPHRVPSAVGVRFEAAAHRIAVERDGAFGVYVTRRDAASRLASIAGGRLVAGVHEHAGFDVEESADRIRVAYATRDGATRVAIDTRAATRLVSACFAGVDDAEHFYRAGSVAWSPDRHGALESVALESSPWRLEPLHVASIESSWFDDERRFPRGSIELDSALVLRDVRARWTLRRAPALSGSR
jgi:uncharacterized protein YqjF (DUF2071 family)